ncbi:MAG: DUF4170 domain-containing protein [Alphaproteobacteria bacterium]
MTETAPKQHLHLVFGGELTAQDKADFRNISKLDIVGIFPNYENACEAWKEAENHTVDNALMRYFIVPIQQLLYPSSD